MNHSLISISYLFGCLTTETEKYVNENNYIMNSTVLKFSIRDHREQEETERTWNRPTLRVTVLAVAVWQQLCDNFLLSLTFSVITHFKRR